MKICLLVLLLNGCASVHHYKGIDEAKKMISAGDIKAIEWLFSNQVNYFRDYYPEDEFRNPDDTLKLGLADCDDYFTITCAIISSWDGWMCEKNFKNNGKHITALVFGPNGIMGEFDNGEWKQELQ